MEGAWEDAVHSLRDRPNVIDIRNVGLVAGIELRPRAGKPTDRAARIMQRCFEAGLLIRTTADIVALSPPLVIEPGHVDRIVATLGDAIMAEAA
jgi:beta-alanine--pyruvate transaminase